MEKIQGIIEGWRIFNISPGTKIREERSLVLRSLVHNKVLAPRRVNEAKHIGWYFDKSKSCPHEGLRCGFNMFRMNKEFNVEVLSGIPIAHFISPNSTGIYPCSILETCIPATSDPRPVLKSPFGP